jgi:hypothetical protein
MRRLSFVYSTLFRVQFSCFFAGFFLCFVAVNIKLHPSSPMWVFNLILMIVFLRMAQVSTTKLRRQVPQISSVGYSEQQQCGGA